MKGNERPAGPPPTYSRRAAIGLGAAALAGAAIAGEVDAVGAATPADPGDLLGALRPEIAPRAAWGGDLPVIDPILPEEDVRFLLVHHTASTNDYSPDDVVDQIRAFHRFHTGPERGWPDVAYNFFVDRFGGIWEARQGSVDGPVRGDATGGSQGFALLCSLIGDHSTAPVSAEASESLVALLAWLAERHQIDTEPGATVEFVSRGSNRWPVGAEVTAATISGHRDMSQTTCPGDFAYDLLAVDLPRAVSDRRSLVAATLATVAPEQGADGSTRTTGTTGTTAVPAAGEAAPPGPGRSDGDGSAVEDASVPVIVAGGAALGLAALARSRRRRAADGT